MEHKVCVVISLQRLSEIFLIPRWIQWDIINVHTLVYIKYPLLLSDFNETSILSTDFRKLIKLNISRKSVQRKPCCSTRTDGQTDRHDHDNWRFSKYCERAQKMKLFLVLEMHIRFYVPFSYQMQRNMLRGQMKLEILCYVNPMVQTRYPVLVLDLCQAARIHLT